MWFKKKPVSLLVPLKSAVRSQTEGCGVAACLGLFAAFAMFAVFAASASSQTHFPPRGAEAERLKRKPAMNADAGFG